MLSKGVGGKRSFKGTGIGLRPAGYEDVSNWARDQVILGSTPSMSALFDGNSVTFVCAESTFKLVCATF